MANNDRVADLYYRRIHSTEAQDACRDRIHWLCAHVEGRRVLDVGCSQGVVPIILAREGCTVVGLDIEPATIEAARAALRDESQPVQQRVTFRVEDAFTAEFEPNSFDTVIFGEVLEHLSTPERLLERAQEWLRPGGRVVVSVPLGYEPFDDHKRTFYLLRLLELLGHGFDVVKVEPVHAKYLCAIGVRPTGGMTAAPPAPDTLLAWAGRCENALEMAQRRAHEEKVALQADRRELSDRAAQYREAIANLKKSGDELRQQVRSAEAALKQEQSTRSRLERELSEATRRATELSRRLDAAQQAENRLQRELQQQREAVKKAQSLSDGERQRRQRAEAQLERLKNRAEYYQAELALREQEVRYRLGDAFVRATRPSPDTLKLPFRFVKLFFVGLKRVRLRRLEAKLRQLGTAAEVPTAPAASLAGPSSTGTGDTTVRGAPGASAAAPGADSKTAAPGGLDAIATLAEPYSSTPPELRRRNDVCVAAVTDEFSWRAWQYEAELYTFTPKTWREALDARKPDWLLIESAWSGLKDSWYFQIRDLGKCGEVIKYYAIPDIVAWCRQHGVPTVFYNKEDPPNFDVFIDAAKQFDYVFTSDANCIPDYRKHVGHDRVFALPFAAQPRIHNPIMTGSRTGSVCFAGTWYSHRHFARHEDAHKILRPALDFDLHIFDRMAHSENPNYRWPDEYLTAVRGALPYSQMLAAYKRYKVFLNINSVKNSPTMFARRVFELLACGTPVISSYSEGIEQLLGPDVVLMSDDEKTTRELLERVLGDDEYRERLALSGQRKVFGEHTYMHRLSYLRRSIGLQDEFDARPGITCICPVEDADDIVAARKLCQRQRYERRALILCANDAAIAGRAANAVGDMPNARVVSLEDAAWGHVIKQAVDTAVEGRVALMNPRDFYGPFYLTDYAHTTDYVDQEPIGKAHYYTSDGGATPTKSGKPLAYRYVSDVSPWTLCLSRADARARAAALVGARSAWEWCNRAVRATERFYSPDCFSYVRCEEVTPTGRTPVAVSRAAASRSEALTAISA